MRARGSCLPVEPSPYASLADLPMLPLQVSVRAQTQVVLPPNAASTLRGAFGGALKRLVCVRPDLPACPGCPVYENCAFPNLFEPRAIEGQAGTSGLRDLPRPYVIRPVAGASAVSPGGEFRWQATLIGRAIEQLPYFALAWRAMGESGIGRGGGRFDLLRIDALDLAGRARETLYDRQTNRLSPPSDVIDGGLAAAWGAERCQSGTVERVELRFRTPTLLKRRGEPQPSPEFPTLWHAVQLRLSLLRLAHGAGRPEMDFRASLARAEGVRMESWDSVQVEWERYSRRQDRRVPMGGFIGTARYRGVPAEFLPALKLGSLVGVGDNCTFGQGWYEVELPGE